MSREHRFRAAGFLAIGVALCASAALAPTGGAAPRRSPPADAAGSGRAGTGGVGPARDSGRPSGPSSVDPRWVAANTRFGFKLYSELRKGKAQANVLVSPASVAMALAMTYNGAGGTTREAMARALDVQGMSLDDLDRASADLKRLLTTPDPGVQLEVANSLWARRGLPFSPRFMKRNEEFFGAQVSELDFSDPAAPGRINAWVSENTHGKIPTIVDRIGSDSILFLINAIYFKGRWAAPFDKALTKNEPFHLCAGGQRPHPTMHRQGRYPYFAADGFQAIRLPYGGGTWSMLVFLPSESSSLAGFERGLTGAAWDSWMRAFVEEDGEIALPRFKVEFAAELNDALKALGMGVAFDPRAADFKNMIQATENAFINQVRHKTYADVNEEGTEAAAATSVGVVLTSARRPREPFRMIVDRPFFWAIRDERSGEVLFVGSIVDPQ